MRNFEITVVEKNGDMKTYNFSTYQEALEKYYILARENKTADIYLDQVSGKRQALESRIVA